MSWLSRSLSDFSACIVIKVSERFQCVVISKATSAVICAFLRRFIWEIYRLCGNAMTLHCFSTDAFARAPLALRGDYPELNSQWPIT